MELRQLKYFYILSEELNFSKAANKLCISQGTLSQQIRQLENEIGSDLFERTSRTVVLTEAGAELTKYAHKALDAAHECKQIAYDLRSGVTGTLNIGITHSFKYLLKNTMSNFIRHYPGIRINVYYGTVVDLLEMIRKRDLDCFVAFKPSSDIDDIETLPLFDSKLAIIMRRHHPLSDRASMTADELCKHPLVLPAKGLQSRKYIERISEIDVHKLNVTMETNDPNILLEIISATNLLAITSTLAISYRNDLISIPLAGINSKMTGCIHRLKNTYVKKSAKIFSDMLMESAELERIGNIVL